MNSFYIITFNNAFEATQGEQVCKNHNINVNIMPTPTYITMSCGISIKCEESSVEEIIGLIKSEEFKCKKIYKIEGNRAVEITTK